MRNLLKRRQAQAGHDSGFTMIELLIVMAIFSGIIAIATGVILTVQKQTVEVQQRVDAVGEARLAIAQIDRQVRSGNVLYNPTSETATAATPYSMRIYTQANGDERCVQWRVKALATGATASALETRSWTPTWQSDGQVTAWRTVARGLLNVPKAVTPFSLYANGGDSSYGSRLMELHFVVQSAGTKSNDVFTSLAGRNTVYGYDLAICNPVPPGA